MPPLDSDRLFFALGAAGYLLAVTSGLPAVFGRRPLGVLTQVLVGAGFAMQSVGLYMRGVAAAHCPIGNPFEVFQFITWSLIVLYCVVGPAFRMSLLGFFTSGMAGVLGTASLLPGLDTAPGRGLPGGYWIEAHASLSLFSYGAFALLAVTSGMYLLQSWSLKRRRWESFFTRLPSLVELERVNLRLLVAAVTVYTVAVAAGALALERYSETVLALKLTFAIAVWVGYAGALALRLRGRLFAQRLSTVSLVLFCAALATLYPVELNRDAHRPDAQPPVEGGLP